METGEKLPELVEVAGMETTREERKKWETSDEGFVGGPLLGYTRRLARDVERLLRENAQLKAAHPAEPEGMELETTVEERAEAERAAMSIVTTTGHTEVYEDALAAFLSMFAAGRRSGLKKAEATYQQPVGDEEVERLRQRYEVHVDVVSVLYRLVRERDALSTQLRDAQARGKGMEEALRHLFDLYNNEPVPTPEHAVALEAALAALAPATEEKTT